MADIRSDLRKMLPHLLKAREEELSDRCRRLRREVRKAKETAAVA